MTVTSSKNVNTAALVAAIPLDVATPRMIVMKGGGNEAFHSVRITPENENVLIGETHVGGREVRPQMDRHRGRRGPTNAESFIRGATLRTRGRAGRSAEDRLLCKQEALGSNPSRSNPPEVQSKFPPPRNQFGLSSNFRFPFGL